MKKLSPILTLVYLLLSTAPAYAQEAVPIGKEITKTKFFAYTCVTELVFKVVDAAIIMSGLALFVYLVWGGIEFITSGGDKTKTENARNRITHALTGVAIVASAFALWKIGLTFFGINAPDICTKGI